MFDHPLLYRQQQIVMAANRCALVWTVALGHPLTLYVVEYEDRDMLIMKETLRDRR